MSATQTPDPDDLDPDIEVPEGTEIDVPDDVLQEFIQSLDAYEEELRERLGEQFSQYEDIDHKDSATWVEGDHPRSPAGTSAGGQFQGGGGEARAEGAAARREAEAGREEGKGNVVQRGVRAVKSFGAEEAHAIHSQLAKIDPEHRKKLGHNIRAVAKSIPSLLRGKWKEEAAHAKHAAHGLRALASGQRPSPEQMKGLRNIAVRILMTAGSVAVGDPTGSVGHLATAFAQEAVQHVVAEHAIKTMIGGGMVAGRKLMGAQKDQAPPSDDVELTDEDMNLLQQFAEAIAKSIESFDPDDYENIDHPDIQDAFEEAEHNRDEYGQFSVQDVPLKDIQNWEPKGDKSRAMIDRYKWMIRSGQYKKQNNLISLEHNDGQHGKSAHAYTIADGHHRFYAHQELGKKSIAAKVYEPGVRATPT
jgi:hypothetical protein